MSYLDDPRVFLAIERTLLAWTRTEISILAVMFILKKYGLEEVNSSELQFQAIFPVVCGITILLSVLSTVQSWIAISKLGKIEVPGPLAKPLVLLGGLVSILFCVGASYIVLSF